MKFIGGEPRIRYLKMVANQTCNDEWELVAMIHFTGAPASDNQCDNDVVFGVVDRVILDGTDRYTGPRIAVSAQAEGYQLHPLFPDACNRNLLGRFLLNRSELYNTQFGVVTTMRSNAQVDINFNTFRGQDASVWVENANQNTSISKNSFLGHATDSNFYAGIVQTVYLEDGDTPPATSRISVSENSFDLRPFASEQLYGVLLSGRQVTDIGAAITRNTFTLSFNVVAGIATSEISKGNIAANAFRGDEEDQFIVEALALNDLSQSTATGWTVSGNDFWQFNATFYENTSGNYFGPGQAAGIFDQGSENIVIDTGNFPLIIDRESQLDRVKAATNKASTRQDERLFPAALTRMSSGTRTR